MRGNGRRSTVDEIRMKYKREPSLAKSIYVEDSTDKSLIKWFLKQANIKNVTVYTIDTVDVDTQMILDLNLYFDRDLNEDIYENNNRSRVITLTTLIDTDIVGIIDSDFDFLEKPTYPHKDNLCKTDYACMEMYCFNEKTLDKILLAYEAKQISNFITFKTMISNILIEIFLIRYAKANIQKSLKKLDLKKDLKLQSKTNLIFNRDNYLDKYLKNKSDKIKEFNLFIDDVKTKLPIDVRKVINGHDFVYLMQVYLEIKHADALITFEKSLYSSLEFDTLKEEEMFQKLLSFLKN
ncbi:MAG: DUF4435 domain-containing protein [Campylobacterota bacterium]|nr:DUF4435 domain-containing protein [Campylobacterota bacterium]